MQSVLEVVVSLPRRCGTSGYTPTPVRPGSRGRNTNGKSTPRPRPDWCWRVSLGPAEGCRTHQQHVAEYEAGYYLRIVAAALPMPPVPAPVAAAALPMPPVPAPVPGPPPMPPVGFVWDEPPPPPPPARTPATAAAWTAAQAEALKARVEALTIECEWWRAGMESVESDTRSYTSAEWDEWRASFW